MSSFFALLAHVLIHVCNSSHTFTAMFSVSFPGSNRQQASLSEPMRPLLTPSHRRSCNQYEQVERGSYTHGLDHEPSSGYAASGATMATFALPASSSSSSSSGGGHYAPQKPRDATLDLINQMKQQHAQVRSICIYIYGCITFLFANAACGDMLCFCLLLFNGSNCRTYRMKCVAFTFPLSSFRAKVWKYR